MHFAAFLPPDSHTLLGKSRIDSERHAWFAPDRHRRNWLVRWQRASLDTRICQARQKPFHDRSDPERRVSEEVAW